MNGQDFLEHYGVLGMKWGKSGGRRGSSKGSKKGGSSSGSSEEKKEIITSDDHNKKVKLKRKSLSEMSNAEIKSFNDRMNLEKSYKDLTKAKKSAGRKLFDELIVGSAKETAKAYITKQMKSAVGVSSGKSSLKIKRPTTKTTKTKTTTAEGTKTTTTKTKTKTNPKAKAKEAETLKDKVKEEDIPKNFR